jgi:hypothetical protein
VAEWHVIADDTIRDMRAHFQAVCESWADLDEKIRAVERQYNSPERGLTAAMLYKETGAPLSDETKEPARSWTWQSCAGWRGCLTAGIGLSRPMPSMPWAFMICHWCDDRWGCVDFPVER